MSSNATYAKQLFYKKDYDAAKTIFIEQDMLYEAGLCSLLLSHENEAKNLWLKETNLSPALNWGFIVLDLINLKWKYAPSFFQVRAYLEVYLNLLIENKLYTWAENIISANKLLVKCNPETYKFIARVLFANGYFDLVHQFIGYAKKTCFLDPEAHFIESQTYFCEDKFECSLESVNTTLKIVPGYYPAEEFKKLILTKM